MLFFKHLFTTIDSIIQRNKWKIKRLTILTVFIFLTSCTANGPSYEASLLPKIEKGEAAIVIYRPLTMGGGSNPSFAINEDKKCPTLAPDGFTSASVKSGKINLSSKAFLESTSYNLETKAGKTYYLKVTPNMGRVSSQAGAGLVGLFTYNAATHGKENVGTFKFDVIDEEAAKKELVGLKYVGECKK